MKGLKGIILIISGILLAPLGFWIGWRIEYTGPMGMPTMPYTVPGMVMFFFRLSSYTCWHILSNQGSRGIISHSFIVITF